MRLRIAIRRIIAAAAMTAVGLLWRLPLPVTAAETASLPEGWLLWHCYTSYEARDSRLLLRDPDGTVTEICGDFVHAMNGSFGTAPERITFMAIDRAADEWDIFLYDDGIITNLTQNSGFRNEDPKWSPDGTQIVFKRGHWDPAIGGMVYDLALLDVQTGEVTMLTHDSAEEAMPCFSEDGMQLYYASYTDGIGSICRMTPATGKTETIYAESGVTAYYPIFRNGLLYFTRWYSADNRCDQILCFDGEKAIRMAFNSECYDCSDACPLPAGMLYSSTKNGGYDLYYDDGSSSVRLDVSSAANDLGADFFPITANAGDVNADGTFDAVDIVLLQRRLLAVPGTVLADEAAGDFSRDGVLDVFDLGLMKRALLKQSM